MGDALYLLHPSRSYNRRLRLRPPLLNLRRHSPRSTNRSGTGHTWQPVDVAVWLTLTVTLTLAHYTFARFPASRRVLVPVSLCISVALYLCVSVCLSGYSSQAHTPPQPFHRLPPSAAALHICPRFPHLLLI